MAKKTQRYRECVVTEAAHVPLDYLPIGDFHDTETTLHRYLVKQCEAGAVKRFRLGRLLFVHKEHIEEARRRYAVPNENDTQAMARPQYESVCESLADIASGIGYIVPLLERLAAAAEAIAAHDRSDDDTPTYTTTTLHD